MRLYKFEFVDFYDQYLVAAEDEQQARQIVMDAYEDFFETYSREYIAAMTLTEISLADPGLIVLAWSGGFYRHPDEGADCERKRE
jgi:hypothetical protein